MRQENIPYKEAQMQFLRLWKEHKAKELQLAEEIIRIFLKKHFSRVFVYYAEVPEWPNGTEEMSKLRSIWRKVS